MAKRGPNLQTERGRMRAMGSLFGNQGVAAASAYMGQFLKPGFLGRLDDGSNEGSAFAKEQGDIRSRFEAGLGGYTAPQYQAQREQMMRGVNSNLQTSLGQLAKAQARGKVYGAAASAQSANALRGAEDNKNQLEQDLYVKNIDEQQKRLGEYANLTAGLREEQLGRQKTNLGQTAAENSAQQSAFLGIAGLGLSKAQQKAMRKLYERGIGAVA